MAKNNNLTDFLTNTANAIRTVDGTSAAINPQDFETRIKALKNPTGNIQLTQSSSTNVANYATATVRSASGVSLTVAPPLYAGNVTVSSSPTTILDMTGYEVTTVANSVCLAVNVTTAGWYSGNADGYQTPAMSVGYVNQYSVSTSSSSSGTSLSLTVTPSTANKYVNITAGYRPASYLTVSGDANLIAGNIKSGVSIFGVTGSYAGSSPSGNIELTQSTSTNVANYATATVRTGSATPSASYATLSSAGTSATSVTSQYFKITPTASVGTAGWISSINNGTVQNYTVRSAATFTMTGSAVTDAVTIGTVSSGYYPVSAKVKGTVAASTSGWFSSSGAVQASTATQVGKIAQSSMATSTSSNSGTSVATITPTTSARYVNVSSGYHHQNRYVTVSGDSNLVAGNIKSGTSIFGVTGTYAGSGGGGSSKFLEFMTTSYLSSNGSFFGVFPYYDSYEYATNKQQISINSTAANQYLTLYLSGSDYNGYIAESVALETQVYILRNWNSPTYNKYDIYPDNAADMDVYQNINLKANQCSGGAVVMIVISPEDQQTFGDGLTVYLTNNTSTFEYILYDTNVLGEHGDFHIAILLYLQYNSSTGNLSVAHETYANYDYN